MKILLIDGKFFLYRSLNVKTMLTYNDINTSMYYYLLSSINSIYKKFEPDNIIILWDSNHSYRKKIFPDYKKKDTDIDENLQNQLDVIKAEYNKVRLTFKWLGFASYNRYGLEADDLFCLYCEQYRNKNEIIIASRDEDLYQLLHETVIIYDPKEKKIKTKKWFEKEYGIKPEQWGLFKAIGGCKSDKIPGLKGVGEKTALQYIKGEMKNSKNIKEQQDLIDFYLQLTLLPLQNPGQRKNLLLRQKYTNLNIDNFVDLCQTLNFKSFLEKLDEWKQFTRN